MQEEPQSKPLKTPRALPIATCRALGQAGAGQTMVMRTCGNISKMSVLGMTRRRRRARAGCSEEGEVLVRMTCVNGFGGNAAVSSR